MRRGATSPEPSSRAPGVAPRVLIVVSLALQAVAATRILCPPQSIAALRPMRVACAPCLWPFTDYPMYSAPHAVGDTLAWIEARWERSGKILETPLLYEVQQESADEPWGLAFEREELRIRAELEQVPATDRSATLVIEHNRVVMTDRGLIPVSDEGVEVPR